MTRLNLRDTSKSLLTNTYSPAGVMKLVNIQDLKDCVYEVKVTVFLLNLFNQFNNLVDIISLRTFLRRCNGVTMS